MEVEGDHRRRRNEDEDEEEQLQRMMRLQEDERIAEEEEPRNRERLVDEDEVPRMRRLLQRERPATTRSYLKVHYTKLSILTAILLVHYALRSREQAYLAITFLTSSKIAYIILGNAAIAIAVSFFHFIVHLFLGGLRLSESEAIGENIRWNVTETCLALTVFRSEVDVSMGVMFLLLVLGKCLHWSCELRGSHLRMTEEAFYFYKEENPGGGKLPLPFILKLIVIILPQFLSRGIEIAFEEAPRLRWAHFKFIILVNLLLSADVAAVTYCGYSLYTQGPSVHILFAFEAAILCVSALSVMASYQIHIFDGVVNILHHILDPEHHFYHTYLAAASVDRPPNTQMNEQDDDSTQQQEENVRNSRCKQIADRLSNFWKDHRATFTFAIELLAQAATFLFYLLFFAIVFTYYGAPLNICREVYISYQTLRRSLTSFATYCRLTNNMNERFPAVTSDEEIEESGRICIICRDRMEAGDGCRKLPGCGHMFHKHCLREWLVQQQTCPTCRSDIQAGEARARMAERLREEEEEEKEEEEQEIEDVGEVQDETKEADDSTHAVVASDKEQRKETVPSLAFPCLYRVSSENGADIFQFDGDQLGNKVLLRRTRTISKGRIIVCTDMKHVKWDDENDFFKEESGFMLNMPDGWVNDTDIERILPALRLQTDDLDEAK